MNFQAFHGSDKEIKKFTDIFAGGEKSSDAEGPGIYFTNSHDNSEMWGKYTHEVILSPRKVITNQKPASEVNRQDLKMFLDQVEDYATNRAMDEEEDKWMAIEEVVKYNNTEDEVWHSLRNENFNQQPQEFMRAMAAVGYDAMVIRKGPEFDFEDVDKTYHYIVYNPDIVEVVSIKRNSVEEVRKFVRKVLMENAEFQELIQEEKIDKILYHGSPYVFENFKSRLTYFSDSEEFARDYADRKSFEGAMDREPNIYKVQVKTDLFDINDEQDYKKLVAKLPDTISVFFTNFPMPTDVPKNELLMGLQGYAIEQPNELMQNSKIGDSIEDKFNNSNYEVFKIDDDFVYGFSKRYFNYAMEASLKNPLDINSSSTRTLVKPFKEVRIFLKSLIKKYDEGTYASDNYIQALEMSIFGDSKFKLVDIKDISNEDLIKAKDLYENAIVELKQMLMGGKDSISKWGDNSFVKKFIRKPRKVELEDTWRYYENDVVVNLIYKLGYGGYIAKEDKKNTYAIFNPEADVEIIDYKIDDLEFKTLEEFRNYQKYQKQIYEKDKKDYWRINRWEMYKLFKQGAKVDDAFEILKQQ